MLTAREAEEQAPPSLHRLVQLAHPSRDREREMSHGHRTRKTEQAEERGSTRGCSCIRRTRRSRQTRAPEAVVDDLAAERVAHARRVDRATAQSLRRTRHRCACAREHAGRTRHLHPPVGVDASERVKCAAPRTRAVGSQTSEESEVAKAETEVARRAKGKAAQAKRSPQACPSAA